MKCITLICWMMLSPARALASVESTRRQILRFGGISTPCVLASSLAVRPAVAADDPMTEVNELLRRIHNVPTFCLVDPTKEGAAYMVFKNDGQAMAIGYAFTTFEGALVVLSDAQRTAKEKGYFDTWESATITTIPMDVAVRLALKKRERQSQKAQSLKTLLQIIPGANDRTDGISIDGKFKSQGSVPLFYTEEGWTNDQPLRVYLARRDLVNDWVQAYPDTSLPRIKALDMVAIFENLILGRSDLPTSDLVFEPTSDALKAVKELKSRGLAPYNPDKMII